MKHADTVVGNPTIGMKCDEAGFTDCVIEFEHQYIQSAYKFVEKQDAKGVKLVYLGARKSMKAVRGTRGFEALREKAEQGNDEEMNRLANDILAYYVCRSILYKTPIPVWEFEDEESESK